MPLLYIPAKPRRRPKPIEHTVEPGSPLVGPLIGGCTDKTCRLHVGTYVCVRFDGGRHRRFFESEPRERGRRVGRERLLCSPDARSPWVGKHTDRTGTHIQSAGAENGVWSGSGRGDFEGHEKSIKETWGRRRWRKRDARALCTYTCRYTETMRIRHECTAAGRVRYTPDIIKRTLIGTPSPRCNTRRLLSFFYYFTPRALSECSADADETTHKGSGGIKIREAVCWALTLYSNY